MFTKFCIRALLIISCVFAASNLNAGVSADTIVQTQDGPKSLRVLKIGDKILCSNVAAAEFNIEEGVINSIEEVEANEVIEITTSDNVTFYVAADQKLFVTHKWVEARQLTLEDVLLTKDRTLVKIMSIRHLQTPMTLRFITVDKNPTFWAAENGVLVHNGPVLWAVGYLGTKVICYGLIATAAAAPVAIAATAAAGTAPAIAAAPVAALVGCQAAGVSTTTTVVIATVAATGETGALMAAGSTGLLVAESVASTTAIYGAAAATVGAIESLSSAVGAALLWVPFI